jgi:hypothetical protein
MYQSRSFLKTPRDEEKLWRYIDLSQFIYLLSESCLYFSKLGELDDKWEGTFPNAMNELMTRSPIYQATRLFTDENHAREYVRTDLKQQQHFYGVNCWHLNEVESVAMWKLYTSGIDGVAIQTTVGRLTASLALEPRDLFIAEVQYIDHEAENVPEPIEPNVLTPLITKRRSFRHEREVRAILDRRSTSDPNEELGMRCCLGFCGEPIHVDTTALIERIVVAQEYPAWAISSLQEAVTAQGISITIETSDLLKTPDDDVRIRGLKAHDESS